MRGTAARQSQRRAAGRCQQRRDHRRDAAARAGSCGPDPDPCLRSACESAGSVTIALGNQPDRADDAPAVEAGPAPAASSGAGSGDVPTYDQAASAPGANLPELKLDLHAYSTNPADRFVFLNMVKLKEGQSSPAGVRVEAITPDGAVLSWQGSRFFLQRQ